MTRSQGMQSGESHYDRSQGMQFGDAHARARLHDDLELDEFDPTGGQTNATKLIHSTRWQNKKVQARSRPESRRAVSSQHTSDQAGMSRCLRVRGHGWCGAKGEQRDK